MRTDLLWRALVPAAAAVTLLLGVPSPVPGLLALAGTALAAERLARSRALGLADAVLVAVGGVLVAVGLIGVVLGSTPLGLSPTTWTAALAALGLGGLVLAALVPTRQGTPGPGRSPRSWRAWLLLLPWVAASVAVVAVAVGISAASLARVDRAPVELSLGRVVGTQVEVVVSSADAVGPLEVRTTARDSEVSYPLLTVPAGGSVTTTLALPEQGRVVIALSYPDQTQPLRTLVLDR